MTRRAFILVTALVVLTTLLALGTVSLTQAIATLQDGYRLVANQRAFHLSEAAVDAAVINLRGGQLNDLATSPMGGGSFWAEVSPAGNLRFLIDGHGLYRAEQREIEALVQLTPQSVFQFSLFGSEQVIVTGRAITDSYDSRNGAYDPNAPGDEGDVGTNATNPGGVDISGNIAINGQVEVGPNVPDPLAVVTIGEGSVLVTNYPPVVSQSVALATPAVSVPAGLSCTDLTVSGQTTLTLSSAVGQHCFTNLTVSGGGTLTADGPVAIYVTGAFTASGNTRIGIPTDPTAVLLFLISNQQATIASSLTGSTEFYGGFYAPTATVDINGNAEVFGSVIARVVNIAGDAEVHYDKALGDLAEPVGRYDAEFLSWREP